MTTRACQTVDVVENESKRCITIAINLSLCIRWQFNRIDRQCYVHMLVAVYRLMRGKRAGDALHARAKRLLCQKCIAAVAIGLHI